MQTTQTENVKLLMLDEMQRAIRMQKANKNLYDYLLSTIQYVIEYATKHNIPLPKPKLSDDLCHITNLIDEVNSHKLTRQPKSNTKKTDEDVTEPYNRNCQFYSTIIN